MEDVFQCTDNFGNKTHAFYGMKRFKSFNDWAFGREEVRTLIQLSFSPLSRTCVLISPVCVC